MMFFFYHLNRYCLQTMWEDLLRTVIEGCTVRKRHGGLVPMRWKSSNSVTQELVVSTHTHPNFGGWPSRRKDSFNQDAGENDLLLMMLENVLLWPPIFGFISLGGCKGFSLCLVWGKWATRGVILRGFPTKGLISKLTSISPHIISSYNFRGVSAPSWRKEKPTTQPSTNQQPLTTQSASQPANPPLRAALPWFVHSPLFMPLPQPRLQRLHPTLLMEPRSRWWASKNSHGVDVLCWRSRTLLSHDPCFAGKPKGPQWQKSPGGASQPRQPCSAKK